MHIIRAGVDSLYLAVQGTLPARLVELLSNTRAQAAKENGPLTIKVGESGIPAMVEPRGQHGGYHIVFDTGPLGSRFAYKVPPDKNGWNLFIKPHASALLSSGFHAVVQGILQTLTFLGGEISAISVNRIDYAIDIRDDEFMLNPARFMRHPRAKLKTIWGQTGDFRPSAVTCGSRIESVTIGRSTGWQVVVYDKTAEARSKQKLCWFEAWRIDPDDKRARVWRVELRLCRDEIKTVQRLRNLADLPGGFRAALSSLMSRVRYVADGDLNPVIGERCLDPIWTMAGHHLEVADLLGGSGDLPPNRVLEITRQMKIDCHTQMITGNAAALAAVLDLSEKALKLCLPDMVGVAVSRAVPTDSFQRSFNRARLRQHVFDAI